MDRQCHKNGRGRRVASPPRERRADRTVTLHRAGLLVGGRETPGSVYPSDVLSRLLPAATAGDFRPLPVRVGLTTPTLTCRPPPEAQGWGAALSAFGTCLLQQLASVLT